MPYSVIVVEDEPVLRTSFLRHVDWAACGFAVVYDCASAEEAVRYMEEHGFPDLIFVDICLFQMNGIELCRYLYEHHPQTRKLLLTGYSDFEYAKQAIAYDVNEYLLKPVEPAEVERLLHHYAKELLEARHQDRQREQMSRLIRQDRQRYIENLLADLARAPDAYRQEESEAIAGELDFSLEEPYTCVCLKYTPHRAKEPRLSVELQLQTFFRRQMAAVGVCYLFGVEHQRIACLCLGEGQALADHLRECLRQAALLVPDVSLSAGLSLPQRGLGMVRTAYEQASIACDYDFYFGEGGVIPFQPVFGRTRQEQGSVNDLRDDDIAALLAVGNWKDAAELLQSYLDTVKKEQSATLPSVQEAGIDLIAQIYRKLADPDAEYSAQMLSADIQAVTSAGSVDEIGQVLSGILERCGQTVQQHFLQHTHNAVDTILAYLQKNYAEPVSLDDLSRVVYLNPRYICTIIKRDTGKTFYELLTEIRIKKACELLRDPAMKMYQISQAVGFGDTKTFNQAFKRSMGQTPSQYRRGV